jgi:hypothetical protein
MIQADCAIATYSGAEPISLIFAHRAINHAESRATINVNTTAATAATARITAYRTTNHHIRTRAPKPEPTTDVIWDIASNG